MPFADIIGHERAKSVLQASILNDRVGHAYLFHGEDGIGKRLTALRFAQALSCETTYGPQGPDACGTCRACRQIDAQSFPDLLTIEPDRERAVPQIKIEQIRELEHHIVYRPLVGSRKIFLIDDADRMTLAAANALLKTLEEPPAHSLFILISSRPSALPPTVRSRCHAMRFAPPARTQVEAALILKRELPPEDARFLAMSTGARIGDALRADLKQARAREQELGLLASPETLGSIPAVLGAAEALTKSDRGADALDWLGGLVRDLVLVRIGADADCLMQPHTPRSIRTAAEGAALDELLGVMDAIDSHQRSATRHLNTQLALESVLLRLRDAMGPQPAGALKK